MYNQFILEELKTLKDLLDAGAITQGEFDHLKQILIDGTKASNEAVDPVRETNTLNGLYENPEDVIRYYLNEAKNLVLYKQFDKAFPFIQKVLALRPEHKEALRLQQEIKSRANKDYIIGAGAGIVLACFLSILVTSDKNINFILLCLIPLLTGFLVAKIYGKLFLGKINFAGLRYTLSGLSVIALAVLFNMVVANGLAEIEQFIFDPGKGLVVYPYEYEVDTTQIDSEISAFPENADKAGPDNAVLEEELQKALPDTTPVAENVWDKIPGKKEEISKQVSEEKNVKNRTAEISDILSQYYKDFNKKPFNASKYFADQVDRFITLRNTTPKIISDNINNYYYSEFQNAVNEIDPSTLKIERLPNGYYQADFEETMHCYRKSLEQEQTIRTKVKIIFDRDLKIKYNHQERILEKKLGLKVSLND
jgi:hypothetical protein